MDPVVSSALIGGASSVANNVGGVIGSYLFGKRNERWARQDATTAFNRQRALLNEEISLNSPAAQMQRYINAGLNPNLVLDREGNIGAPSVPQAQTASADMPNLSGNYFPIMDMRLKQAQIDRLNNQNENDSKMTDAEIERFAYLNRVSAADVRLAESEIALNTARSAEVYQGIENMKVQYDSLSEDVKRKQYENAFTEATQQMRIQSVNAESEAVAKTAVALAMAKLLNIKADTALKWSHIELNQSQIKVNDSQILLNKALSLQAATYSDLIVEQIQSQKANTERIMTQLAGDKNYNAVVYGSSDDGWFMRAVHTFTGALDATFRCAGQIIHATSVTHN